MKTFAEFHEETHTVAEKPVYVRRKGEQSYELSDDVFVPKSGIIETREDFRRRLKLLRNAALPKGWKGMTS